MTCTRALGELYRTHGGYEHVCWFSCYSLSLLSPQCLTHCNCSLNEKKEGKSQKVLEQWQEGTSFPSRGRATSTQWRTQATKRWASEVQCTEQRVGTYLQSLGTGWGTWTESMSQGSQETLCAFTFLPTCTQGRKQRITAMLLPDTLGYTQQGGHPLLHQILGMWLWTALEETVWSVRKP